ncbi:hypothetical protein HDC37_002962 [Microbacterium sp. AK009]|nr:hypothetical protein [Microbacterium sp. AK009]
MTHLAERSAMPVSATHAPAGPDASVAETDIASLAPRILGGGGR